MPDEPEVISIGDVQESVDVGDRIVEETPIEESWTLDITRASMGAEECESCSA